jgi:hypothetical protein
MNKNKAAMKELFLNILISNHKKEMYSSKHFLEFVTSIKDSKTLKMN